MESSKFFFVAQFPILYNQTNTSACFLEPVFSLETHEPLMARLDAGIFVLSSVAWCKGRQTHWFMEQILTNEFISSLSVYPTI